MDFLKIIQSLQDLVYEIVVWALLLPKTILRAVLRPDLMTAYVNQEWGKEPEEQFDEYLSPTLFFLLVAVLPSAMFTWMTDASFAPNSAWAQLTESNLITSTITTTITLLIYLVWLEWLNKRPLRRSGLKRLFFIQCYLITPPQLIYILLVFWGMNSIGYYNIAIIGAVLLIIYESFAFKDELKVSWWKGLGYAALPYLIFTIFSAVYYWLFMAFSAG